MIKQNKVISLFYTSSITLSILMAIVVAAVSLYNVNFAFAGQKDNIKGWAWGSNTGYISLNSSNCTCSTDPNVVCTKDNGMCRPSAVSYGLNLKLQPNGMSGSISGWAWSENLGWMRFGGDSPQTPLGTSPSITFNCKDVDGITPIACDQLSWYKCNNVANKMCSSDVDCNPGDTTGGLCNVPVGEAPGAAISGWAKLTYGTDSSTKGWVQLRGGNSSLDWSKVYFERGKCVKGDGTGTNIICTSDALCGGGGAHCQPDSTLGAGLGGYAWQYEGGSNTKPYGNGWISFNSIKPDVLFPYLKAEGGDIYSAKGIKTAFPPPAGEYNAKYLVHVAGKNISARFKNNCPTSGCPTNLRETKYSLDVPIVDTTNADAPYSFKLGRFDFKGLFTVVKTNTAGDKFNKYGYKVVIGSPFTSDSVYLDGKVYAPPAGDITVTAASNHIVINNGNPDPNVNTSGSGTVIIRGNLNIDKDIWYSNTLVPTNNLASLVWIVLGDVKISPTVTKVAGSFIILGKRGGSVENVCNNTNGTVCTNDASVCGNNPDNSCVPKCTAFEGSSGYLYDGCGKFVTGNDASTPTQLRISGSVFARQFKLDRTYVDAVSKKPAEQFVADGRLQLNPPPGMVDFAKGLPTFQRQ